MELLERENRRESSNGHGGAAFGGCKNVKQVQWRIRLIQNYLEWWRCRLGRKWRKYVQGEGSMRVRTMNLEGRYPHDSQWLNTNRWDAEVQTGHGILCGLRRLMYLSMKVVMKRTFRSYSGLKNSEITKKCLFMKPSCCRDSKNPSRMGEHDNLNSSFTLRYCIVPPNPNAPCQELVKIPLRILAGARVRRCSPLLSLRSSF